MNQHSTLADTAVAQQLHVDYLVVGAGISGLSCALALEQAGHTAWVIERALAPGGRMATRKLLGQTVDYGVPFLHGFRHDLRRQIEAAGEFKCWPAVVEGRGKPCQPSAFRRGHWRLALHEGVNQLPSCLAKQVATIRYNCNATQLQSRADHLVVRTDQKQIHAKNVILALAHPQSLKILKTLDPEPRVASIVRLLSTVVSIPVLSALVVYQRQQPPPWDLLLPDDSEVLHTVVHDSAKRSKPKQLALVAHCQPRWSRQHIEQDRQTWGPLVVKELQQQVTMLNREPLQCHFHRWRYAQLESASEFRQPFVARLAQGGRLALIGELFAPGGGVEAAYDSGQQVVKLLQKEDV